jgi:hypothetical protein
LSELNLLPNTNEYYKDPTTIDNNLGISVSNIFVGKTLEESLNQIISSSNKTVSEISSSITEKLQIDSDDMSNFAEIPKNRLKDVLGEPMVNSINEFFITADTCEAYTTCSSPETSCPLENSSKLLYLEDLFTLKGR